MLHAARIAAWNRLVPGDTGGGVCRLELSIIRAMALGLGVVGASCKFGGKLGLGTPATAFGCGSGLLLFGGVSGTNHDGQSRCMVTVNKAHNLTTSYFLHTVSRAPKV